MKTTKLTGLAIAATAAVLFANGSFAADSASTASKVEVHCAGINSCKGKSTCKTAINVCAGMNSCKGKGRLEVASEKECTDKGGTVYKG